MSGRRWLGTALAIAGVALIAAGVLRGFIDVSWNCGAVFRPAAPSPYDDETWQLWWCAKERHFAVVWTYLLIGLGAVSVGAGTWSLRRDRHEASPDVRSRRERRAATHGLDDQLRSLDELHRSGALTSEEFTAAKRRLLER